MVPEPGRPPRVLFVTFGCKVNRAESETALAGLIGRGWEIAEGASDADVVVVNTCTVTAEADHKMRKGIRRIARETTAPVVVTGCAAVMHSDDIARLGPAIHVERDKTALARTVERLCAPASGRAAEPGGPRPAAGFRVRAAVKVQDGCEARCAYCIVPDARGPAISVPLEDVEAQVRGLVAGGTREVVLTGINLGRYAHEGADLADLVAAVASAGPGRVRLSSIEPLDLTERLLGALAAAPQVCPHLHVPLQSGSDAVLSAMRRGYTAAGFEAALADARAALPGLAVTTDVIVGFPGESEADFAETVAVCERVGFAKLHVFRYSPRPGTPAAEMPGRVPVAESSRRAAALRGTGDAMRAGYVASRAGASAEVLVETVRGGMASGTTRDYLRVAFLAQGAAPGELADVALAPPAQVR